MHTLLRIASYAVPAAWRETVYRDLADEARTGGRGALWCGVELVGIGIRMRLAGSGIFIGLAARHVVRTFRRSPGFLLVSALTFALGIGLNIAVFSVLDRLMFRPGCPRLQARPVRHAGYGLQLN